MTGRQRGMLQVEPLARAEPAPAPGFPETAVLIDQPSLSSAPGLPPDVAGATPDTVLDGATFDRLAVRAASVRGDAHRYSGETRQDAMGFWRLSLDALPVLLGCVADGVGSEPLSHIGAAAACRFLRESIEPALAGLMSDDADAAARDLVAGIGRDLRARAEADGVEPDAYATTLTAAVVAPGPDGVRAVALRVGDSSAMVLGADGWAPCFAEENDDMFSPRVHALPRHTDAVEVARPALAEGDMLLLCTDGLTGPMRNEEVRDTLAGWWGGDRVPDLAAFLWQVSFRAKSFSDDRTALCVWTSR